MTLLRVENLTARYGASQALFGVDFTLAEGEVLALMGRNGMGKTTTVKAICRMIPSQGRLEFFRPKPACSSQFPVPRALALGWCRKGGAVLPA